jgi:5-methylcytosine-specific restriction endonuclease McrA
MIVCNNCKISKEPTEFSVSSARKNGRQAKCKACDRLWCIARKDVKAAQDKARYEANPELAIKRARQYVIDNPEKVYARGVEYRERNADVLRTKKKEYRESNAESISAWLAGWRSRNVDLCRQYHRNRKARTKGAQGSHTRHDIDNLLLLQKCKCAVCKVKLVMSGQEKYHVDHKQAIANGGSNNPENLQILCKKCNLSKGAKDEYDWAQENGRLL